MSKIFQRSYGSINIELFENNFIKYYQNGCSKILNPNSYTKNNDGGKMCLSLPASSWSGWNV